MTYQYLAQFEKYVMPVTESGCWIWLGYISENGYGRFSPKWKVAPLYAHRASYEIYKGSIPYGLTVDHLCRVRCCVNPDHLEVVTQHENLRRGTAWLYNKNKTHCKQGHTFSPENTRHKNNRRICIECERKYGQEKYQRNRAMGKSR
jgi:hypothetical protein